MSRSSLRAEMYRGIQKNVLKPLLLPRVFKRSAERERIFSELTQARNPTEAQRSPVGWFHAASVGELEMLAPVIEKWAALKAPSDVRAGVVLTIFSESAQAPLEKLAASLRAGGARVLFAGFAPWEGEWKDLLARVGPAFMMTARYEAWPELWMSLGEQGIPLLVVGAKARASLKWAKRICGWAGERLPKLRFFSILESELSELRNDFPECELSVTGDPRWERVAKRAQAGSPRARELMERYRELPRPWGVLGSAWKEDLKEWSPALREGRLRGTLWVVPHRVEESFISPIEAILDELGDALGDKFGDESGPGAWKRERVSSGKLLSDARCLVVDEMGFLAELYSAADWAYVGGGFSHGVHNTIEPAIHGIPVACGPKNAERFPEIGMLESTGQLCRTANASEIARWLEEKAQVPADESAKGRWKAYARSQLGASDAVMRELLTRVSEWQLRE